MKLKIKKLSQEAKLPGYAHPGDAGMDLYSCEDCTIKSGELKSIKTGIAMEIPLGFVGLIWDKSSISSQNGIHRLAGVIDSGYRGEIIVVLANLGRQDFEIKKNQKIAQMLIQKVERMQIEEESELSDSSRGKNGFGSTGKN